jgi:hypothetical protein
MTDTPRGPRPGRLAGLDLVLLALLLLAASAFHADRALSASLRHPGPALAFLTLGGLGVLGLRSLRAQAASLAELAEHARALGPALGRIADALERAPAPAAPPPGRAPLEEVREAIDAGDWGSARRLVGALAADRPGTDEAARAADLLDRGREAAERDLRARLDASRAANDPEAVLDYHRQLAELLAEDALRELERELIRWLMALLMRRMRTGTVRADVAALAQQIAERFPASPEGASLRASLPTLRRSAGLCPRCARPYAGIDDACPECLAPPEVDGEPDAPKILALRDEEADEAADAEADEPDPLAEPDEIFEREPE